MKREKCHEPYVAFKLKLAGKGLTYKNIAALLGVSESTVQLKINGYSDFYISEQRMICDTFDIEASIFFVDSVA